MPDLFESPRQMLDWGKKRIVELGAEIDTFAKDEPWTYIVESDEDTGKYLHKLVFTDRMTEYLPNILFDAANNLRSALDQIAFAVAVKHTGNLTPKSAKFPYGRTEDEVRNNAGGGCKDLPMEIRDLFVRFKPYDGGNGPLRALNKLANTPKHMALVPLFVGAGIVIGDPFRPPYMVVQKKWHRDRNEIVFLTTDIDAHVQTHFSMAVAFDGIDETIRGKHPVGALDTMASEVERVLTCTEVECRRIGLIT